MPSSVAGGTERAVGEIITFYSYKGGTGRSMALANVAYILAADALRGGKRVLMVDWDLEAPGLHRYFFKDFRESLRADPSDPGYGTALKEKPGLMDFLVQAEALYRSRFPTEDVPESKWEAPEAVACFQEVLRATKFSDLLLPVDGIPNLKLLKAGCQDSDYPNKVRKFDWESFYSRYGSFFTHFRGHLMQEFDFVLIDSRTGLTDTSGICTRVMPEKLVAVFVPNLQNIDGIEGVIRGAAAYRRNSRDVRGLVAFPLAARIDGSASNLRHTWWRGGRVGEDEIEGYEKTFERLFTELYDLDECHLHDYFDATQIPHDSDYAYGERIAARSPSGTSDKLSIGAACANLTRWLVEVSAPWELLPDPARLAEAAKRKAEEEAQRAEAQTIIADEATRRAAEEAARAEQARRHAEEMAQREAEATRLAAALSQKADEQTRVVAALSQKADEQTRVVVEIARTAARTRRVAYSVVGLVLAALLGYGGWIWWLYTDSGRLWYINREARQLAAREGISNGALLAWALARVRSDDDGAVRAAVERIGDPEEKYHAQLRVAVAWSVAGRSDRARERIAQAVTSPDPSNAQRHMLGITRATAHWRVLDLAPLDGYVRPQMAAESVLRESDAKLGVRSPQNADAWILSALAWKEIGVKDWLSRLEQALAPVPPGDAQKQSQMLESVKPKKPDTLETSQEQRGPVASPVEKSKFLGYPFGRTRLWSWVGHPERASQAGYSKSEQAVALAYAAIGWVAADNPARAQEALNQVLGVCSTEDIRESPAQWLMRVGVAYALLGKHEEATQSLEEAESQAGISQGDGLADHMAVAWARAGRPDRAARLSDNQSVYPELAKAHARAGKPNEALRQAAVIDDYGLRSQVLEAIAIAYSRVGDLKRAVETAARQTDDSSRLEAYAGILSAWEARMDNTRYPGKRWPEFDADAQFKDAWTELWWPGSGPPPRMPGGSRSSVW